MNTMQLWHAGPLLLAYVAILTGINVYSLNFGFDGDDLERTAEAILGVTDLSEV